MELALNEKQIPQFVGNNRKRKQDMEGLERVTLLAKQVLSFPNQGQRDSKEEYVRLSSGRNWKRILLNIC